MNDVNIHLPMRDEWLDKHTNTQRQYFLIKSSTRRRPQERGSRVFHHREGVCVRRMRAAYARGACARRMRAAVSAGFKSVRRR